MLRTYLRSTTFVRLVLGGVAFLLYGIFPLMTSSFFSSPDETANYYFAHQVLVTSRIAAPLDASLSIIPEIHPRSVINHANTLIPLSFPAFPFVVGFIAKLFGSRFLLLFTPAIAALSIVAFESVLEKFFSRRRALFGSILLALHPAFWYGAGRSMFHNSAFVALLIIGIAILIHAYPVLRRRDAVLGGLVLGLAVAFRSSEILWIGALFCAAALCFRITDRRMWLIVAGAACIAIAPFLLLNASVYHHAFGSGYQPLATIQYGASSHLYRTVSHILFPFGLSFSRAAREWWLYWVQLMPWAAVPTLVGLIAVVIRRLRIDWHRRKPSSATVFGLCVLVLFVWLILLYGSWDIVEQEHSAEAILGSSFLRYWLPLYVLAVPFLLEGIRVIVAVFSMRHRRSLMIVCVLLFAFFSIHSVWFDRQYGFQILRRNVVSSKQALAQLSAIIPRGSIILTTHDDKVVFPTYPVIATFTNDAETRFRLANILKQHKVFLLNDLFLDSPDDVSMLQRSGLQFQPLAIIAGTMSLYRLSAVVL